MRGNKKGFSWILLLAICMSAVLVFAFIYYPPFAKAENIVVSPFFDIKSNLVNVNNAPAEELALLPGIGEKTAENIVEYRNANGVFEKPEDLLNVTGIGKGTLEKIKDYICF